MNEWISSDNCVVYTMSCVCSENECDKINK
jgi:hypothetical protein